MKWMAHEAPGKSDRDAITMMQLCDMFPTEERLGNGWKARLAIGTWSRIDGVSVLAIGTCLYCVAAETRRTPTCPQNMCCSHA